MASPELGDEAIGAPAVTTFRNLYIGRMRAGNHPGRVSILQMSAVRVWQQTTIDRSGCRYSLFNLVIGAGAEKKIHFGQSRHNIFTIPFGQTTRNDQPFANAAVFVFSQSQNGIDGFVYGRFNKTARVDHNHISILWMLCMLPSARLESAQHHFAVHLVPCTAKTD